MKSLILLFTNIEIKDSLTFEDAIIDYFYTYYRLQMTVALCFYKGVA